MLRKAKGRITLVNGSLDKFLIGAPSVSAALGMGMATVVDAEGQRRNAACIGGMLSVLDGSVTLVPTTFEWAENIDTARAEASLQRAKSILTHKDKVSETDIKLAEARLHRALVRKSVASSK